MNSFIQPMKHRGNAALKADNIISQFFCLLRILRKFLFRLGKTAIQFQVLSWSLSLLPLPPPRKATLYRVGSSSTTMRPLPCRTANSGVSTTLSASMPWSNWQAWTVCAKVEVVPLLSFCLSVCLSGWLAGWPGWLAWLAWLTDCGWLFLFPFPRRGASLHWDGPSWQVSLSQSVSHWLGRSLARSSFPESKKSKPTRRIFAIGKYRALSIVRKKLGGHKVRGKR